jgi:hypothetical protein
MPVSTGSSALAQRVSNECKSLRTLINGNAVGLTALTTSDKTSLVGAVNSLKAVLDAVPAPVVINDATSTGTTVWSSSKVSSELTARLSALTTGAPAALDTLDELAQAIGDDANYAATVTAALGNRLRFDAAQTLTLPQQAQARANAGAAAAADLGNPDIDLVAIFNAGLV